MSDRDPEKFRLALRQMALDAALEPHEDAPPQVFEPLRLEVEDRLVQLACQNGSGSAQDPAPVHVAAAPPALGHTAPGVTSTGLRRNFGRLRSRPLWATVGITMMAAAAAAIIAWRSSSPSPGSPVYVAMAPTTVQLPGQEGKLMLGAGTTISSPVRELRLSRRQTLSLVLSPQKGGGAAEQVYTFIRHKNQPPRPWGVVPQKADHGAFVLSVPLREAPAIEPEQDLLFVVGPDGPTPDPMRLDKPQRPSVYSLVTVHLVVSD